jgi:carboxynorspermidine decarboxylase
MPALLSRILENGALQTPAFVVLRNILLDNCRNFRRIADSVGACALHSLKSLTLPWLVPEMAAILDGFSVSSLYEARLARELAGPTATLHGTAPGLRPDEMGRLARLCDFISLNSPGQLERCRPDPGARARLGLRVNPGLSFARDPRYDPCAARSRLGVPVGQVLSAIASDRGPGPAISGFHFHSNCESSDFNQLRETSLRLVPLLRRLGSRIEWINLGGGYYFPQSGVPDALERSIELLRAANPGMSVYLEPGTALVQDAAVLVTTVLDVIDRRDSPFVVLDTTINHLPEVFDYGFSPDVHGAAERGAHAYQLTGRSCLAGDVFGRYRFESPLKVGDRLCLLDVGSYSLAKANMFNGIPLPSIYLVGPDGFCELMGTTSYEAWIGLYGGAGRSSGSVHPSSGATW